MDENIEQVEQSYRYDPTDGTFAEVSFSTPEPEPAPAPSIAAEPIAEPAAVPTPEEPQSQEPISADPITESAVESTPVAAEPEAPSTVPEPDPEPTPEPQAPVLDENFYKVQAQQMVERGELPKEILEQEELDGETIMTTWEATQKNSYIQKWQGEALRNLESQGFNKTHLEIARRLDNGVTNDEVEVLLDYRDLSTAKISEFDVEDKKAYIRDYLSDKDVDEFVIESTISTAEVDDRLDDLISVSQEHFKGRFREQDEYTKQQADIQAARRQQEEINKQNFVSSIFTSKKIGNTELSDDEIFNLHEGLTKRTQPYNTEQGVVHITPFEAFVKSMQNNYAAQLQVFNSFINNSTLSQKAEERLQTKIEQRVSKQWGAPAKVSKPASEKSSTKSKTTPDPAQYRYDTTTGEYVAA